MSELMYEWWATQNYLGRALDVVVVLGVTYLGVALTWRIKRR